MRQATVQAIAYTRKRRAFGNTLYNQPLMRNVLVDFALESEAAEILALRLAEAYEHGDDNISAKAWRRFLTPASKYWVCKRAETLTAEAMEVFGGNGYVDDSIMARLFKEAPVNSIWEGSGNVMCLDVLRSMRKEPNLVKKIMQELLEMADDDAVILKSLDELKHLLQTDPTALEAISRLLTEKLMLLVQACLMKQRAPEFMSKAFIELRLNQTLATNYGAFKPSDIIDYKAILERAFPWRE
jgi:putative acyl-CoA dehydrogenase